MEPVGACGAVQVDLESGLLLDSCSLRLDFVELARSQGAHLCGHLLLVLGVSHRCCCFWWCCAVACCHPCDVAVAASLSVT